MASLVFLDTSTVTHHGDVDLSGLESLGTWKAYEMTAPSETADRVGEADIVISNKVELGEEVLAAAPRLQLICVAATGTNNVALDAARSRGIQVCNVRGYSTESVAQHALAMMLNLATQMHRYVREPEAWAQSPIFTRLDYPMELLEGKTLGLMGVGDIGSRVGELAEAFGMRVQCYARPGSAASRHPEWARVDAEDFFATSDIISLHCPLTPETRHVISEESLGRMRPGAFLINTGRGELVEETALLEALRSGRLGGAGLDVLSEEPPPAGHPLIRAALECPQLLITPHNAWSSARTRQRLIDTVAANIRAFLDSGEADNRLA